MNHPNRQALTSFEKQTVEHPADIRPAALYSPLIHNLCRLEGGDVVADGEEKLRKLVAACMNFGKKGKLTITLEFAPSGHKSMQIKSKVTANIPEGEGSPSHLFCTPDGQLTAYDPDQPQMQQPTIPAVEEKAPRIIELTPVNTRQPIAVAS